jgi:undecaprenyl phosphate-alpha-L-ara4N flippase subunit ArnE
MIWKLVMIVLLRTAADLSFKGAVHDVNISPRSGLWIALGSILRRPLLWVGLALGAANVVAWSTILQHVDLSYAYPFLSFSFVAIIIGGRVLFKETLDSYKIWGVVCITAGSMLLLLQ